MTTYTQEQIAALLADITPGEWTYSEYHQWVRWGDRDPDPVYELDGPIFSLVGYDTLYREADAKFIAASPAIIAQQIAKIESYEKLLHGILSGNNPEGGDLADHIEAALAGDA